MTFTEKVKKRALQLGADAVGIAPIERFAGAPVQMDPRQIMPEAKSVIVMAFRFMRGSLRGIEEGTFFSNYSAMGYGGLTYLYIPLVVINLARFIEDAGYEAFPMGHQSDWRAIDNAGVLRPGYSRPVRAGKPAPDVMVHLRIAAFLAGLGEIGYSKVFLTPQFGPRQRLGIVITEAELKPDPIYNGPKLCNRCLACVKECPAGAISATETVRVTLAGHLVEWGKLDLEACNLGLQGARYAEEGDPVTDYLPPVKGKKIAPNRYSPFYRKPPNVYKTGTAICGGKGCLRACLISLEKRNVLHNKFKMPFRRRTPWEIDWSHLPEQGEEK